MLVDDVLLDLRGSSADEQTAGVHVLVLPEAVLDHVLGVLPQVRVGSHHFQCRGAEAMIQCRAVELHDGRFGAGDIATQFGGQVAIKQQLGNLGFNLELSDFLAHHRVCSGRYALIGAATSQLQHVLEEELRAGRDCQYSAFVGQRRCGVIPTAIEFTNQVLLRDTDVFEEDFVEVGSSGHLSQRLDGNARALHVHDQVADTSMLGGIGSGADQEEAEISVVRSTSPDLLAIDHKVVTVLYRPRLYAGKV